MGLAVGLEICATSALVSRAQREVPRCSDITVAGLGDEGFQDLAFVINRTPEPVSLATDLDAHLIDMPSMTAVVSV